jgi:hypothetical protein
LSLLLSTLLLVLLLRPQVDCNILDDIEEIEQKRIPVPARTSSQIGSNGYSYDDTDGTIVAPPITAVISKQESQEVSLSFSLSFFLAVRLAGCLSLSLFSLCFEASHRRDHFIDRFNK